LQQFVALFKDRPIEIPPANCARLSLLCTEFGFDSLGAQVLRRVRAAREERLRRRDREFAPLSARLSAAEDAPAGVESA
jgi:hypothetical protein